ncbi:ComEC/Rec2 family competence protein [Paraclostridium sordellii]|uniref:ComEC/Rec2 family competence protein n=1 Tax=Paraclostridium sordellii TaxID=1505 RepID=UPI000386538C|nr:MBL fold metallo-hydrolase [Paeniclostridium sordellii]EPZ56139.1 metallo-beta-lactamase superfamily protein [[Clostridium] sordellii VPI 9048] [Paeniclostridium sordellii VPI 9048]CEK38124.1 Metallo-beta-lactamase superfamily exported protein [[Clostridium] sordellii] [Paeniclostridium sordellii]
MSIQIVVQQANNGDCIWIRFGEDKKNNIVIDSGPGVFAGKFRQMIRQINNNGETVDLLILTHIDDDHINGFRKSINSIEGKEIKKIWLNGDPEQYYLNQTHSPKNIGGLVKEIRKKQIEIVTPMLGGTIETIGDADLTVLTPTYKDMINTSKIIEDFTQHSKYSKYSLNIDDINEIDKYYPDKNPTNKASISFIFSYEGKNIAFLGDAHAEDICNGLIKYWNKGFIDMVKLSHHGSKHNTSCELLDLMECNEFIITKKSPIHKETISRIVRCRENVKVYCNYDWWISTKFFTKQDLDKYLSTGRLDISVIDRNGILIKE